jgi:hypothetical protein
MSNDLIVNIIALFNISYFWIFCLKYSERHLYKGKNIGKYDSYQFKIDNYINLILYET